MRGNERGSECEKVSEGKAVKCGARTCKAWVTQRAALSAADKACKRDGPRPDRAMSLQVSLSPSWSC